MEDFLKKNTMINLLTTIVFFILGIVLCVIPVSTLSAITYAIEITLIVTGILTIINYIRVESKNDVFSCGFVQGIVCILLALFLIANPKFVFTVLPVIIGIWMVFGSLTRMQVAIRLNVYGQKFSVWYIIFAVIMFTIGIFVICNPFETSALIIQMIGIGIIAYSVFDLIENISVLSFLSRRK